MRILIGAGLRMAAALLAATPVIAIAEGVHEVDTPPRPKAVTNGQALAIETGTSRDEVLRRLGEPMDAERGSSEECLRYGVEGPDTARGASGELVNRWSFCFEAGRLVSKGRRGAEE